MTAKPLKQLLSEKQKISREQMIEKSRIDNAAGKKMKEIDAEIEEAVKEEIQNFWEEEFKPKLHELVEMAKRGLDLFSDFEEQFENHVRGKKAEVSDDQLLAEIYGAELAKNATKRTYSLTEKADHIRNYDMAKNDPDSSGAQYCEENGIAEEQISEWKNLLKRVGQHSESTTS